ncbi:TlpA family protein disulfide reductase [Phocaeicola sp.]
MNKFKSMMVLSLMLGASFTGAEASKLTFKIANPDDGAKAILSFTETGDKKEVAIDVTGNGTIEINDFTPQYVLLQYGRARRTLYLDPAQDLTISFDGGEMWKAINFDGAAATVNTYLNTGKIKNLTFQDTKLTEDAFMNRADSLFAANNEILKAANLPAAFTDKEKMRLKYFTYGFFPMHPMYYVYQTQDSTHVASDAFYNKLQSLITIDSNLLTLPEYKEFLPNAIASMSNQGVTEKSENTTEQFVNYIDKNIKDAKVAEYLVNLFVYGNISSRGLDGSDALISMFNKHVKDAKMLDKFNTLCTKWEKLKAGTPSPTFSCPDIDGKTVALADLKGKFVYIDVWATWCGPCRGELPHLKTLEEKYADKDIYFVSLSCDKNKKAWENMVKKDEMKGIQLHLGVESPFMDAYLINGIPRFILLDRDGKIISANMTRPSDPKTAEKFNELLGL